MLFFIVFTILLILITALYVGAEFATVSVKKFKIEALAENGNYTARLLLPHIASAHSLDRYVAACQIGITLASLLMGAVAEKHASSWLLPRLSFIDPAYAKSVSVILVVAVFTSLTVVLGELMPKAIALRFTERAALYLTWPMLISLKLFAPFIAVLNGSSNLILKLFGFPTTAHRHVHSPEELARLVEHGATSGAIEDDVSSCLSRVLSFGNRSAREIMVPRTNIVCIDQDTSREKALDIMVNSPYTRYPVYRGSEDKIVGIVHLKDVCMEMARVNQAKVDGNAGNFSLKSLVRKNVVFCPSSLRVDIVLDKLRESRAYMAVLEDEYGGTDGILTIEDLLEEVLGDIEDEFDRPGKDFSCKPNGDWVVKGILPLDELSEQIPEFNAELREVHTVGGLVMHLAGGVPTVGQTVSFNGFTFRVEKMQNHQVKVVLVHRGER